MSTPTSKYHESEDQVYIKFHGKESKKIVLALSHCNSYKHVKTKLNIKYSHTEQFGVNFMLANPNLNVEYYATYV